MATVMTAKTLNALKGWPQMNAVDFSAPLHEDIVDEVTPGSVLHIDAASNKLKLGVGTDPVMPLFNFYSSNDPDRYVDAPDPATEKRGWVSIEPPAGGGNMLCLVAVMGLELVSTSYVDADYSANDFLTSDVGGGDAGKLKIGELYTDMIVGQVSRGVVDNGYGFDALAFWPNPVYPIPAP